MQSNSGGKYAVKGRAFVSTEFGDQKYPEDVNTPDLVKLDSGTTLRVFNDPYRSRDFKPPVTKSAIQTGRGSVQIEGTGEASLMVTGDGGTRLIGLRQVAYVPNFTCNVVSLQRLCTRGCWWDQRNEDDTLQDEVDE
ncbi:hypothetical protein PspLS_11939 [Pyricularia sp. CBS 133598]|nr:hypothetical protein PspLS_11939 [Pyricularia sp. CBS 133598]